MAFTSSIRRFASALFLGAALVVVPLGAARAARPRPIVVQDTEPNPTPSVPEPAAAIVFGLGVALLAWRSHRSRSSNAD